MNSSSGERHPVEELAEEFIARKRQGEKPSLEEYCAQYPDLAEEIRDLFPALLMVEDLGDGSLAATGPHAAGADETIPELQQLGDYRILREVGRGGMGVVYEAEQQALGRRVALKVLPPHALRDPDKLRRFEREARSAARLHHTNIVPVFGVGQWRAGDVSPPVHYYVMQFIQGLGLDEVLTELKRLRPDQRLPTTLDGIASRCGALSAVGVAQALLTGQFQENTERGMMNDESAERRTDATDQSATPHPSDHSAFIAQHSSLSSESGRQYWQSVARIGIQVAEALAYAHGQGTLHRDIKPSNVLLDMHGTVWVTDFGLAKAASDGGDLTHTGDIVGTIRYMAPERFEGHADGRSDLYSLGLTLYEFLAFQPAFTAADRSRLMHQVTQEEPPRPRRLNPDIPRDLETIVLKAMAREPGHRYATATELAGDLQRFVEDRPIRARRVSLPERFGRWCRRNPALASMAGVVVLVSALGVTVSLWQKRQAEHARDVATAKAEAELEARQQAQDARQAAETTLTVMYTSFGLAAGARDNPRQAVLWFAYAARLAGDDRERADANRTRAAAWGRLAIQPVRAFVHPAEWIENNMALHPGGRHLLSHGTDLTTEETTCRLWDLEREADMPFPGTPSVVSAAAWDATGERLAVGTLEVGPARQAGPQTQGPVRQTGPTQGGVTICRFPSGEPLQRVPYAGRIARVLFSPDGRYCALAAADRVRVWDCRQAVFATPELEHPAPIDTLAFHPQGELLATGCKDQSCRVFAVPAEKNTPLFTPVPHLWWEWRGTGQTPIPPLFLDEGRGLLTLSQGEATWRDPRTGRVLRVLPFGEPGIVREHFTAITLSGDGKHLVLAGRVLAGRFPDKPHVRICDVASAQPVSPNLEHRPLQHVFSAAFSPDGRTLLTGGGDRTARLWSVPRGKPLGGPLTHPTSVTGVAFAPDGRHLATAQGGGLIRLWALPAGNPRDYRVPVGAQSFVRLSRDGRFLLPTGLSRGSCELRSTQVFDLTTGQRVGPPLEANGFILDAAFSPDGLQVAAAVSRAASSAERFAQQGQQLGQLLLWDWQAGKLQHGPLALPSEPRKLDYSPDGRQLAVIGAKGELVVIDPAAGKTLRQWQAHPPAVLSAGAFINNGAVRFSPDNRSLLTFGAGTNSARVWDALTGQLRHELKHNVKCQDVQFSPDGRLVATAGNDNRVCVWELATGEQLASLAHPDWTFTALFSPDGQHLLTACRDGMARLWDWRAGRQVRAFEHEHEVHAVAFTPDGRHVLSASDDGVLRIWEWRTGKPVCPPLALGGAGLSLAVTPDGRRVACGGFFNALPVFHLDDWLAPLALEPDDLCVWGELVSGQRVEDGGGVTNLTAEEWLERWRDFRQRHPASKK